jgi:hypothetical protein
MEKLDERLIEMGYFPREYSLPRPVDDDGSSENRSWARACMFGRKVGPGRGVLPPTAISSIDHCMEARKTLS